MRARWYETGDARRRRTGDRRLARYAERGPEQHERGPEIVDLTAEGKETASWRHDRTRAWPRR